MNASRQKARTVLLLLVEAMLLFGGLIVAVYVRLGALDAEEILIQRHGFYKAALFTIFCLASFYLFDLYDFVVMNDRRELVLRLLQALGFAWVALALLFYAVPQVMIGRGVSLISLPLACPPLSGPSLAGLQMGARGCSPSLFVSLEEVLAGALPLEHAAAIARAISPVDARVLRNVIVISFMGLVGRSC